MSAPSQPKAKSKVAWGGYGSFQFFDILHVYMYMVYLLVIGLILHYDPSQYFIWVLYQNLELYNILRDNKLGQKNNVYVYTLI